MISEETAKARAYAARYISGTITNIIGEDDVRREALQDDIDPQEAVDAISYWQDRLNVAGKKGEAK